MSTPPPSITRPSTRRAERPSSNSTASRSSRDERTILAPLDWLVAADERWLVLGANGCGKTTLLRIASLYLHPSTGVVRVLGEQLGRTDVRLLRRRIGLASAALGQRAPTAS